MVVEISDIVVVIGDVAIVSLVLGVDMLCIVDAVGSVSNIVVVVVVGGGVLGMIGAIRMSTETKLYN